MKLFVILILSSFSVICQNDKINLVIDSFKTKNSTEKYTKFEVSYSITNTTNQEIHFYLKPNNCIENCVSSLAETPIYKIYQNQEFIDIDGLFFEAENNIDLQLYVMDKSSEEYNKTIQSLLKLGYFNNLPPENKLKNIQILKAKETKNYSLKLYWQKKWYYKNDDIEFYIKPTDELQFELTLRLLKPELQRKLTENNFNKIKLDNLFIEGIYSSNKVIFKLE